VFLLKQLILFIHVLYPLTDMHMCTDDNSYCNTVSNDIQYMIPNRCSNASEQ